MRLALDANRYADLTRGHRAVVQLLERAAQIFVPFVVLAELRAGFALGTHRNENEQTLDRFLGKAGVSLLWPDEGTIRCYADVFSELRRAGRPIPSNDLWIAALCIQHGVPLYTRDRHFDHIERLARL